MNKLIKRTRSFLVALIPLPPLNTGVKIGGDIVVNVTEYNNPPKKTSSLASAAFLVILSYFMFYSSFIYLPSFFKYDAYEKNKYQFSGLLQRSNVTFGAPFSLEWNMSLAKASQSELLSKKPLICNGLENGVDGNVECYFKSINQEDLSNSQFFHGDGTSTIRDLLIGSDLTLGFKGNHLHSIRYVKKFGDEQDSKTNFQNQSSKAIINLMEEYEIKLSENELTSKKSHHFVTFDVDYKNLSITISYILYDNYVE